MTMRTNCASFPSNTSAQSVPKLLSALVILAVGVVLLLANEQALLASFLKNEAPVSSSSPASSSSLSPRAMIGEWIGNIWVPPHPWKYYGPAELRELYKDKAIVWMGDSLARRSYANFYSILNATTTTTNQHVSVKVMDNAALINFNKRTKTENCAKWSKLKAAYRPDACRAMPGGEGAVGEMLKSDALCFRNVEWFFRQEYHGNTNVTADIDLVVLSLGIWEVIFPNVCRDKDGGPNRTVLERLDDAIQAAAQFTAKTGKRVVWRTCGFDQDYSSGQDDQVRSMNQRLMDQIDAISAGGRTNLTYVNWAGAVEPRSFGAERMTGDMHAHYSYEPRVVLIQMITNHLQDLGFFLERGIRTSIRNELI